MRRILAFLALAAPLALAGPAGAHDAYTGPRIAVTGEGEAAVAPDMAVLTLAVMREAETARAALDANNEAMNAVISAMKEQGIAERDLQTTGLSINPRYVYPENNRGDEAPRIVAYQVTNTLTARVRDLTRLGAIIDRSVTLGVNQGGNIHFTNNDPTVALTEARKAAVAEAMARARTLAEAAGVELGDIMEISERQQTPPPIPLQGRAMRMEAAADSVPVETGENTYEVHVNVVFEISR